MTDTMGVGESVSVFVERHSVYSGYNLLIAIVVLIVVVLIAIKSLEEKQNG